MCKGCAVIIPFRNRALWLKYLSIVTLYLDRKVDYNSRVQFIKEPKSELLIVLIHGVGNKVTDLTGVCLSEERGLEFASCSAEGQKYLIICPALPKLTRSRNFVV